MTSERRKGEGLNIKRGKGFAMGGGFERENQIRRKLNLERGRNDCSAGRSATCIES